MEISSRSARECADLPSLNQSNQKKSLKTNRTERQVQRRFRCKWWMVRRSSIKPIPAQFWILFRRPWTTNLNMSVLMRQWGCWMLILFINEQMTVFQATCIQFQACPELSVWCNRFGPSRSSWGGGFWRLICQQHWWRMKKVLERLPPQLQRQCFAN